MAAFSKTKKKFNAFHQKDKTDPHIYETNPNENVKQKLFTREWKEEKCAVNLFGFFFSLSFKFSLNGPDKIKKNHRKFFIKRYINKLKQ